MLRAEVNLPPNTRHLAVRTDKRSGKTSLAFQSGHGSFARQPKCRYLLRVLDLDGALIPAGRVGLITFKDCKSARREALGIPAERTGHCSRLRESLAACRLR